MITKSDSFKTEDGQLFASENDAKLHELGLLLGKSDVNGAKIDELLQVLRANFLPVLEILTGSVRVRGKYNRKPKVTAEPKAK